MKNAYSGRLAERYGIEEVSDNFAVLEAIGKSRGCLVKGGEIDFMKAANIVIDEFRAGKLGNITIETVNQ